MLIVDNNIDLITKSIFNNSKTIAPGSKRFFYLQKLDGCELDPGGFLFTKTPWINFYIDNSQFFVQISRAGEMLHILDYAEERVPGYMRFLTFGMFVIVPVIMFEKIKLKLKEIEMSDEGLRAELEEVEVRSNLEKFWKDPGQDKK